MIIIKKGDLKKLSRKEKEKIFIENTTSLQKYWGNSIDPKWWEKFSFEGSDDEWIENRILSDIKIYEEWIKSDKSDKKLENIINKSLDYIVPLIVIFVVLWFVWLLVFWIKQFF